MIGVSNLGMRRTSQAADVRQKTEIKCCDHTISFACPFGQDKAFRAFPPYDWTQEAKDQKGKRRGMCVDNEALDSRDRSYFRVREQDARTKGCREVMQRLKVSSSTHLEDLGKGKAASRSPRKH